MRGIHRRVVFEPMTTHEPHQLLKLRNLHDRARNLNVVPFAARFNPANADPTTGLPLADNFLRPMIGLGNVNHVENIGTRDYDSIALFLRIAWVYMVTGARG